MLILKNEHSSKEFNNNNAVGIATALRAKPHSSHAIVLKKELCMRL